MKMPMIVKENIKNELMNLNNQSLKLIQEEFSILNFNILEQKINNFINKRDLILTKISIHQCSDDEKKIIASILSRDKDIEKNIMVIMKKIQQEIDETKNKRKDCTHAHLINSKYLNNPKQLRGYFIDNKK